MKSLWAISPSLSTPPRPGDIPSALVDPLHSTPSPQPHKPLRTHPHPSHWIPPISPTSPTSYTLPCPPTIASQGSISLSSSTGLPSPSHPTPYTSATPPAPITLLSETSPSLLPSTSSPACPLPPSPSTQPAYPSTRPLHKMSRRDTTQTLLSSNLSPPPPDKSIAPGRTWIGPMKQVQSGPLTLTPTTPSAS